MAKSEFESTGERLYRRAMEDLIQQNNERREFVRMLFSGKGRIQIDAKPERKPKTKR